MSQSEDCIFCRIAAGRASAVTLCEDRLSLAFMDARPASEGHALIISKVHYPDLLSVEPQALNAVALATQQLARAVMQALRPDGLRIAQFNGAAAGQSVFHYHVHVRPVYQGQDLHSHGRQSADPARLAELAERIRAALLP